MTQVRLRREQFYFKKGAFSTDWALQLLPPFLRGNGSETGAGRRTLGPVPSLQPIQWRRPVGHAGESHWCVRTFQVQERLLLQLRPFLTICTLFSALEKYGVIPKKCFPESHSSEASRRMNHILNHKVCFHILLYFSLETSDAWSSCGVCLFLFSPRRSSESTA